MTRKNARIDEHILDLFFANRLNPYEDERENPFDTQTQPLQAMRVLDWDKFERRWEKLERTAKKLGVDVGYEVVGHVYEPVNPSKPAGPRYEVKLVQVWGDAPKIEGWEFLARIDNLDATHATVSFAPGKETLVDPRMWQGGTNCDHCGLKRYRSRRFIVRNVDEKSSDYGHVMVVGSTCLRDFFGHASPEMVALVSGYLPLFDDLVKDQDDDGGARSSAFYYGVKDLMPLIAALTTRVGFRSAKMAEAGKQTTKDMLYTLLSTPGQGVSGEAKAAWLAFRKAMAPSSEDKQLAADTIEWAKNLEDPSSYSQNIRAIASVENIGDKQLGMLASMVYAYMRSRGESQKRGERAERAESRHLGVVGEKITLDLTLRKTIELEGNYGTTYLYMFVTPEGDDVVWKASKQASYMKDLTMPYFTSVDAFFEYIKAENTPWFFDYYVTDDDKRTLYPDLEALNKEWSDVSEDDIGICYQRNAGVGPYMRYDSTDAKQMKKLLADVNEETRTEIEEKRQKSVEAPIQEGSTYRVQAKVKEHGDYKGRPQTRIERAKILALL